MEQHEPPAVAGLILAAGASRRMGRPKQLLDWGGHPLVRVVAETALVAGLDPLLVVVGHAQEQVRAALAGLPLGVALNPDYAQGQASSLRVGVEALPPNTSAALVLLGDQPFVTPAIIQTLCHAWRERRAEVVAPLYRGRRGNPVLFARTLFPELLTISGDQGARALLAADPARVLLVPFDDERPLADLDTPEDYQRLSG